MAPVLLQNKRKKGSRAAKGNVSRELKTQWLGRCLWVKLEKMKPNSNVEREFCVARYTIYRCRRCITSQIYSPLLAISDPIGIVSFRFAIFHQCGELFAYNFQFLRIGSTDTWSIEPQQRVLKCSPLAVKSENEENFLRDIFTCYNVLEFIRRWTWKLDGRRKGRREREPPRRKPGVW